ncbi:hypothetical protein Bhyg_11466, partial [Pseudolycoriella hygida]
MWAKYVSQSPALAYCTRKYGNAVVTEQLRG